MVASVKVLGPLPGGRATTVVNDGFARSNYVGVAGWAGYAVVADQIQRKNDVSKWSTMEADDDFRDGIAIYCRPLEFTLWSSPEKPEYAQNARDYRGIFGENSNVRISRITDGTSNVIAVGERATPTKNSSENDVGNAVWAGVPDRMSRVGQALSLGTSYWPINHGLTASAVPNSTGFNSRHFGVSNFLFADGQVRSITEKVDHVILRKLSIYNDGQPFDHDY
jgi:prepilin-type processing-associated H-X9-DG protein